MRFRAVPVDVIGGDVGDDGRTRGPAFIAVFIPEPVEHGAREFQDEPSVRCDITDCRQQASANVPTKPGIQIAPDQDVVNHRCRRWTFHWFPSRR